MRQVTAIVTFAIYLMTLNAYAQYRNDAFLPHIANGSFDRGSYRTTFILFNNTDNNDSALLRLTDNDGKLLTVTIPGLGSGSEFAVDLPPGATRIFQTDGSGGLLTGAATVTSSSAIGLSAIFSV